VALRRSYDVAATVERDFEEARVGAGLSVDQQILATSSRAASTPTEIDMPEGVAVGPPNSTPGLTLRELYDAYMSDPTRDWSPRTRLAYDTTRRLVLAIVGETTTVRSITRAHCRTLIDTLRWLPRNALKLYPRLSPIEIAAKAKQAERTDLMSPSNINTYLNKVSGVFNWAVKEEMMDRNPAKGLRVPDATLRRDKRRPFSISQLAMIFAAPLYTGCRDDGHGYAVPGDPQPELSGRHLRLLHTAKFVAQLFNGFADMFVPAACFRRHPDAAEVLVSWPIAEPAPHLEQGVVHH
jgi:hypothetical protein